MTSIEKASAALSEWIFNVVSSVLPKIGIPTESAIGKFMYGILGVNPATYNVWRELGFLAEPMIQTIVTPMAHRLLAGIPEDQIKDIVMKFADAFIEQAQKKGGVNLFGLQMGENAFTDLKTILQCKFEEQE